MAKKNKVKPKKKSDDEVVSLTKEELQNMKFKLSIEIPKKDFDDLLKAMLNQKDNITL